MTIKKILAHQGIRFLFIGGCAALTHFLLLICFVQVMSITPAWANVLAFLGTFFVSFLGHYYITFETSKNHQNQGDSQHEHSSQRKKQFFTSMYRWLSSSVFGFLLNQGLFLLGLHLLGHQLYILTWLIATILVTLITFFLGKLWAFR